MFNIDWIAAKLVALLTTTLFAFFSGYINYPYGWIIITLFLMARIRAMVSKDDGD